MQCSLAPKLSVCVTLIATTVKEGEGRGRIEDGRGMEGGEGKEGKERRGGNRWEGKEGEGRAHCIDQLYFVHFHL